MKCWIAAAVLLSCVEAKAAVNDQGEAVRVVVYMSSGGAWLSGSLISQAQAEASRLFLSEGIHLEWRAGRPPKEEADRPVAADVVAISFHPGTPTQFETPDKVSALAIAYPYGKGPLPITVFSDRVVRFLARYVPNDAGKILGHVLAHEITHILQCVGYHSDTGLMRASWTFEDYFQMLRGHLPFTPTDLQLLQSGILSRAAQAGRSIVAINTLHEH